MRLAALCLMAFVTLPSLAQAPPTFKVLTDQSQIKFKVTGSMGIDGTFKQWDSTLVFSAPDPTTGVLNIEIQAASVDTGSGMKNGKMKGKDFFDVEHNPVISFKSTKIVKTGPALFDVTGDFTIRGVTKTQVLKFNAHPAGPDGIGTIQGTMFFDRKDHGINGSIPFLKIDNRIEVSVNLTGKRTSGAPLLTPAGN